MKTSIPSYADFEPEPKHAHPEAVVPSVPYDPRHCGCRTCNSGLRHRAAVSS